MQLSRRPHGLLVRAPALVLLCACGPGLADPAPWLEVPERIDDVELLPDSRTAVSVLVTNVGTGTARVQASVTGDVRSEAASFRIPAGGSQQLRVELVNEGYAPASGTVELALQDATWSVPIAGVVPSDVDGDGFDAAQVGGDDCDDARPTVFPGADERCNELDDDCDGDVDEGLDVSWWPDGDGDGHGDPDGAPVLACAAPDGTAGDDLDCDDSDPSISPSEAEIWYDDVDQDCDGGSDHDQDGDGVDAPSGKGSDCDDTDPDTLPGAPELPDGLDNDCDTYRDEDFVDAGDLVLTELFTEPVTGVAGQGEWLEVLNVSDTHVDLALVSVGVDGLPSPVDSAEILAPDGILVLCADVDEAANGGVVCDAAHAISSGGAVVVLEGPDGVVDEVDTTSWTRTAGRSLELASDQLDADDNDVESAWCIAVSLFGDAAGDRGTPGAILPPCP